MDNSKEEKNNKPEESDSLDQDHKLESDEEFSSSFNKDIVADLRQKLKKSDEEKREYLLGWQRTKADYINSRKQDEEDKKDIVKFAEANLILEIIPVLDSFEMAFTNRKDLDGTSKDWEKGIEQIYNQINNILLSHGLEVINPTGKAFNPHEAEAISIVETNEAGKDDEVVSVLQKGYKLHGRVIRPAKVRVAKYTDNPTEHTTT